MTKDDGYHEAERRIEGVRKSKVVELDLSSLGLTAVPETLSQLTQLQILYLADNQLTAVPETLGQLSQLQILSLENNQLTAVPETLGQLSQLQRLNLGNNQLTAVPETLGQLPQLQILSLANNQLSAVPETLGQLSQLQKLYLESNQLKAVPETLGLLMQLQDLYLAGNQLKAVPDTLGQLMQLRWLNLTDNQLKAVPDTLGQLMQLRWLNLDYNQLTAVPETLGQLTQLRRLNLDHNQLTVVPETLGQLTQLLRLNLDHNQLTALPETLGQLTQLLILRLAGNQLTALPETLGQLQDLQALYLHGNPALKLPPEILGPPSDEVDYGKEAADPRAILAYYFSNQTKSLNEVRLLLVGHGRVGKTSLSKALRDEPYDEIEPETPGIERHPLPLKTGKSTITAHVWDFGGQEFLHQTHQFFFSERSIYTIVLTGRQGRPMQEAEYWLRLIRAYGSGSPVVIALNQIRGHPFTVDEYFLKERYPEVKAIVSTDCAPRFGIEPLRKLLGKVAGSMPSVRQKIDPSWVRIRNQLESMRESFVSFDRYQEICLEEGVNELEQQEVLATILNCIGIALNYRDDPRLRDTSVLKPRWLVDGIYTVLRWLQKRETGGMMQLSDFSKALKDKQVYPKDMHAFLLALMEKFELCFAIKTDDDSYLVPALLNANQPRELKKFMGRDARRIQFQYDDLRPPGLMPRFIVRSHTLSEKQPRWLRGVVLARGQSRALVRADHEGRMTEVFILGDAAEDRVWLSEFILSEMSVLNDRLSVRTLLESESQPGAWTDREVLQEAAQKRELTRTERVADGATAVVSVMETLREFESPEASDPGDNRLPLFICYACADKRMVETLIPSFKVLARRGYVEPWRDTDLIPGDDWDETVRERLGNANIVLYMVSTNFLASDYISNYERPLAWDLMSQEKAIVVPIILTACNWESEDFAKLENLPQKGKPLSSFNPRSNGWKLIEKGVEAAVRKSRGLPGFSRGAISRRY